MHHSNYHGKNGEIRTASEMDTQVSAQDEDEEELFGVPDPIDGIVYFAKGSLPEHKNEKMDEVDRSNLFDSDMFAEELGTHPFVILLCITYGPQSACN